MKTLLCSLGLALFTFTGVAAQDGTKTTHERHTCIMADAATLETFGLTDDQLTKVRSIQASCEKEHKASAADAAKSAASVAKHEAELQTVLTPEQYTAWNKWCNSKHATKAKADMTE